MLTCARENRLAKGGEQALLADSDSRGHAGNLLSCHAREASTAESSIEYSIRGITVHCGCGHGARLGRGDLGAR